MVGKLQLLLSFLISGVNLWLFCWKKECKVRRGIKALLVRQLQVSREIKVLLERQLQVCGDIKASQGPV